MFFLVLKVILKSMYTSTQWQKTVNHVGKPMDQFKLHGH